MDWSRIRRNTADSDKPRGAYANLDDLVGIQFRARDFSFLPQQPVTSILAGRYASRLRGRGLNFEELRRYQPGDDVRNLDWKVTARTRVPHVRVYTEEKDRAVLLLVDQRMNMFFGTRDRMKSVTAAELAAIGAWRALDVGDRVGAIVFDDNDLVDVPPQRSRRNVMSILGAIMRMNHGLSANNDAAANPGMLNSALEKARLHAPHDVLVVIVSDFFGVDERTAKLASELAEHNDVLALLVHDPSRLDPARQALTASDGSLQMEINLADPAVRERMIDDYRQEQERITHFLRRLSAPLLPVSNEGDVVAQMRRLLGIPGQAR